MATFLRVLLMTLIFRLIGLSSTITSTGTHTLVRICPSAEFAFYFLTAEVWNLAPHARPAFLRVFVMSLRFRIAKLSSTVTSLAACQGF